MRTAPEVTGSVTLHRRHGVGFPWADLFSGDEVLAGVGRFSMLNIFFGRGQRIRLTDGSQWRIKSVGWRRYVCPVVLDADGAGLALSAPGAESDSYGIDVPGAGMTMVPSESRLGRSAEWVLREHDVEMARIGRSPFSADVRVPTPLPAILLGFVLSAFGVLGERDLVPRPTSWA